jgi:hypothetical protein
MLGPLRPSVARRCSCRAPRRSGLNRPPGSRCFERNTPHCKPLTEPDSGEGSIQACVPRRGWDDEPARSLLDGALKYG